MKKFVAVLASASLAVTMLAVAGCGNSGAISGNYVEADKEQLTEVIDNIDAYKVFTEEMKGIELASEINGSFSLGDNSGKISEKISYKIKEEEKGFIGEGTASASYSYNLTVGEQAQKYSLSYSAKAFNDSEYAYLSMDATLDGEKQDTAKIKLNLASLMPSLPTSLDAADIDEDIEIGGDVSYAEMLGEYIDMYKLQIGLDTTNGTKIKISATEESLWLIVADIMRGSGSMVNSGMLDSVKEMVTFNTFKFDAYIALDGEGAFSQASLDLDINAKLSKDLLQADKDGTAKISGYFTVKNYNGKVSIPDGIANDNSYVETRI